MSSHIVCVYSFLHFCFWAVITIVFRMSSCVIIGNNVSESEKEKYLELDTDDIWEQVDAKDTNW